MSELVFLLSAELDIQQALEGRGVIVSGVMNTRQNPEAIFRRIG